MSELETSNTGTEEVTQGTSDVTEGASSGAPEVQEPGNRIRKVAQDAIAKIQQGNAAGNTTGTNQPAVAAAATPGAKDPQVNQPTQHQAAGAAAQQAAVAQAVAEFQANFKYKAAGQEKEIPEAFRAIIKDAESEKLVRELFEKADGLDFVKQRYQPVLDEHAGLTKGLGVLDNFLQKKQFGKFFEAFGLDDQAVLGYAMDRLKYLNLPPEQRARLDAEVAKDDQLEQLQQSNMTVAQRAETLEQQQREIVLSQVQMHPQIAPIAQKYEEGRKPGTFRQKVVEHAILQEVFTGKVLTPEDAVISFIQSEGLLPQTATQAAAQQPTQQQAPTQAAAPSKANQAATLPSLHGQGSSPAKPQIKNMSDLRKARETALKNA